MSAKLKSSLFAASALLGLALPLAARADSVTVTLTPSTLTAAPGSTVTYSGTVTASLTNTASDYLNEGDITFSGPSDVTTDTSDILNFTNAINPGSSVTGNLFTLTVPTGEIPGAYSGTLVLLGGPDFNTYSQLGTVNFNVVVGSAASVTPEPSSYLLLATGLLGTFALARRQRSVSI